MMLTASREVWLHGNLAITALLGLKIVTFSILIYLVSYVAVRNRRQFIWFSATWTFMMSAPVTIFAWLYER